MVGVESERRGCNTCAVTMTREPVAIDLINLGGIAERGVGGLMRSSSIECDERVSRGRLVRPVPSMLNHPSRSQSVSRMSPGPDGLRDRNINYFTQPGEVSTLHSISTLTAFAVILAEGIQSI